MGDFFCFIHTSQLKFHQLNLSTNFVNHSRQPILSTIFVNHFCQPFLSTKFGLGRPGMFKLVWRYKALRGRNFALKSPALAELKSRTISTK